ncbi:MAG: diguanylate cyclase [Marmoricola sp.]|nr:diguanylate cyclase [Marmoricola sp.]
MDDQGSTALAPVVGAPERAPRQPGVPPWIWYGAAGGLCAVIFLLSHDAFVQAAAQISVYVASAGLLAGTWWRVRKTRPDGLLTFAVVAFGLYFGASVLGALVAVTTTFSSEVSVPSLLDGLFLLSYVLLALFLWQLGSRSIAAGRRDLLDTLIVIGGLAPLFWLFLIEPLLGSGAPPAALATYLAYPVSVFGLLALTVRLGFVARRRTLPHLLLAGWIICELSADVVFLYAGVDASYVYGQWWQVGWIVSATCIGALALHARTSVLLERHASMPVNGSRRLYVLAACLATPIATIVYTEVFAHSDTGVIFPAVASIVLVLLLCLRLSGLMVDNATQLRVQERMQRLSADLAHQAMHDPLTGLGNRLLFGEHADRALAERPTDCQRAAAVLLLDLDDFKMVNDTFGHEAGDRVLVEVARRLRRVTRHGDSIFRLGGDEFAFVLSQARLSDALHLADRICGVLAEPFDLGPRQIRPVASIGVSIALAGQNRSTLLAEADMAMYDGKARGSNSPSVFDPVLHRETLDRHQLERDLRDALAKSEIRVLYQPLIDLISNDIIGVEALLRWEHPTRGTIPPAQFIPLAETNGTILDIGDFVMQQSLRQLLVWDEAGSAQALRMSINVSPRQLADPDFVGRVAEMLLCSGLEPARVTLEVTETAFGADPDTLIGRLHQLKRLGVILAIDDFGTDYSSLSQLRRIPVDILKIDKSFVAGIATDPAEKALISAIIRLAASLGKSTIAEGIETTGQLDQLRRLGVEVGQGYLFARPLAPEAITARLERAPAPVFRSEV